jgi:hypothetical protein
LPALDVFRRALGVAAVALAVLFVVRFTQQGTGASGFQAPGAFRAGLSVCILGGVITVVSGRRPGRSEPSAATASSAPTASSGR